MAVSSFDIAQCHGLYSAQMSHRYRNWTCRRVNPSIQNNAQNDEVDAMKAHLNIILEICLQPMYLDRI